MSAKFWVLQILVIVLAIAFTVFIIKRTRKERFEMQQRDAEKNWKMLEEMLQSDDPKIRAAAQKSMDRIKAEQAEAEAKRLAKETKKR